jgi:hypothetical protein
LWCILSLFIAWIGTFVVLAIGEDVPHAGTVQGGIISAVIRTERGLEIYEIEKHREDYGPVTEAPLEYVLAIGYPDAGGREARWSLHEGQRVVVGANKGGIPAENDITYRFAQDSVAHLGVPLGEMMDQTENGLLVFRHRDDPWRFSSSGLAFHGLFALPPLPLLWCVAWLIVDWPEKRRRKRLAVGRCPRCGYDIHHLPEPRCPECGETWEPPPS